jgi:hypothetical protein
MMNKEQLAARMAAAGIRPVGPAGGADGGRRRVSEAMSELRAAQAAEWSKLADRHSNEEIDMLVAQGKARAELQAKEAGDAAIAATAATSPPAVESGK